MKINPETDSDSIKDFIRTRAQQLGFSFVGFAHATELSNKKPSLDNWLHKGYNAGMEYMERNRDKRTDPRLLVENAKTVISFTFNYYPKQKQREDSYQIAKYAYGEDYHDVLKRKLFAILNELSDKTGCTGRAFVDSAPVMEREWARLAGLGWIGKHSLLINPKAGSYFFLAELIIDIKLQPDEAFDRNFCGSCTNCIDACPTQAIVAPGTIDANKCLSYLTIEHKGAFDTTSEKNFSDRIFGCDICQDVCPWNKKSFSTDEPQFQPHDSLLTFTYSDWENLNEDLFRTVFKKSAVKRTKYLGLQRNIEAAKKDRHP